VSDLPHTAAVDFSKLSTNNAGKKVAQWILFSFQNNCSHTFKSFTPPTQCIQ